MLHLGPIMDNHPPPENVFYSSKYWVQKSWWTWSSWSPTSWQTAKWCRAPWWEQQAQASHHSSSVSPYVTRNAFGLTWILLEHAVPSAGVDGPQALCAAVMKVSNLWSPTSLSPPTSIYCLTVIPSCPMHASHQILCFPSWTQWACGFVPKCEVRYSKSSHNSSGQGKEGKMVSDKSSAWYIFSINITIFRYAWHSKDYRFLNEFFLFNIHISG